MRHSRITPFVVLAAAIACNFPLPATPTPEPPPADSPAPKTPSPTLTLGPTATFTYRPPDVPFTIDCSALPDSRQADCDSFLATTRDVVYPIERDLTGGWLSACYKEVHYVILPTDPAEGAGGISAGNLITYNQRYSVDLKYKYDTHEILHTISSCTGALDLHAFHGMVMDAVYDRLGVHEVGYYEERQAENLTLILDDLLGEVKGAAGNERNNLCLGILMRKMTIAYFDLGEAAIHPLYWSTIDVPKKLPVSALATAVWGGNAPRVANLMKTLWKDYHYDFGVPECALTAE
jgi:hypothetical protein